MSFDLSETITIWSRSVNDGYGGITWSTPATATARHADKNEQFIDQQGRTATSKAVVYTESNLTIGDQVFIGASTSASPPASAQEIRGKSSTPSYINLKKYWL